MSIKSQGDDLKNKVLWLMAFRVAIVTLLMGATAFIHLKEGVRFFSGSLVSIYLLVGASYVATIISLPVLRITKKHDWFANLQVAADIILATALVYVTGGIDSIFSFLYIFTIIWAGIVLHGRGVFLTASLSSILYGALLDLQYYGYISALESPLSRSQTNSGTQILYRLFINITAFYTVAFLSNYLFTQLRKTGERLKEKEIDYDELEALNKKIVQEIDSGLMTIDRQGSITSFNKAAEKITGYTLSEAYKSSIDRIFPDITNRISGFNEGPTYQIRTRRWENRFEKRGGGLLHLGFSLSSLRDANGEMTGKIIIFQDLTSQKEMEEAVRRAEKLSAVGTLAAGIAHEIRNPLASMSGSIQVLRNELELDQENRRLMDIILRESERINILITDFLDYARPYNPKKEDVDLSIIMGDTLDIFEKGLSPNQEIKIRKEITPEVTVYGEEEKLKEVLWNLFNNAVQSMPTGGEMNVSLKIDHDMAVAVISDTGQGIDEKDIKKVFEPFFTTKTYGTGLGLATVYRVIEAHEGRIFVESAKGRGTIFTVNIPLHLKDGRGGDG